MSNGKLYLGLGIELDSLNATMRRRTAAFRIYLCLTYSNHGTINLCYDDDYDECTCQFEN